MNKQKLSTDPYKGVRDFYPEDMAIQRYIFDSWARTAESFGYERYEASILEPSDLYRAKGAENEEMVNEQTYTFIDRGDREVTLRPEMTPTVARLVSKKRRELAFPLRWYSIPNLFRYERPQRGRLREHWQLNCDLFGGDEVTADVETIALAHQVLIDFGATSEMFEIHINNRKVFTEILVHLAKISGEEITEAQVNAVIKHADRINKMSTEDFAHRLTEIVGQKVASGISDFIVNNELGEIPSVMLDKVHAVQSGLNQLGIKNLKLNHTLARGFDYYTGTIFEIFDTSNENNRALIGGGRYDNLTGMFDTDPVSGIGFGMGDVSMRDFLETHNLLPADVTSTAPRVVLVPMEAGQNLYAEKMAIDIRRVGCSVAVDFSNKKVGDKISRATKLGSQYVVVVGENEIDTDTLALKSLTTDDVIVGSLTKIIESL